jgi:hypothetical protein
MAWTYEQSTGRLLAPDGTVAGEGYSGHGASVNKPEDEAVPNAGPIPRGRYNIGPAFLHPQCGPIAMRLLPSDGTDPFGRSGFLMHGDNGMRNHSASEGCIILQPTVRVQVARSVDRMLEVVS